MTGSAAHGAWLLHSVGLAAARRKAAELREQLYLNDIDPLVAWNESKAKRKAEAQAERAAAAKSLTFRQCAEQYLAVHSDKWTSAKHAKQWRSTLEAYAYPVIGDLSVGDIDEAHLVKILQPIWKTKNTSASRLRARIENVLGYATVSKFRSGDNPARWRNHLATLLGGTTKTPRHHAALPFAEAPAFIAELRERQTTAARALEFAIRQRREPAK